ncbi:hypothetical protein DICA3_B08702 [Diutina catenulata]
MTERMQIKVLYTLNDSTTPFLSRSHHQYPVRVADFVRADNESMKVGAIDLRTCIQQIVDGSHDINLDVSEYNVFSKEILEADEPFVANGELSSLLAGQPQLVTGRVCQNLSASALFGGGDAAASSTLEVRLRLEATTSRKRSYPAPPPQPKRAKIATPGGPVKATRTKSLPIFNPMHNIMSADKSRPRYDQASVKDRFKSAPFSHSGKVVDSRKRPTRSDASRAMRTRSVAAFPQPSSPIHEELSDDSDDTEYRAGDAGDRRGSVESASYHDEPLLALPDIEDLDSKKCHSVPGGTAVEDNHGLCCINNNCISTISPSWRFIETGYHANYYEVPRDDAKFNKEMYDGMYGPLCNACYLFLRTKGFMRPEAVVRKYLQQKKYKEESKKQEESINQSISNASSLVKDDNSLSAVANRKLLASSSPPKFPTPSYTPAVVNQAIQKQQSSRATPNYDFNDLMSQIGSFGGPLTDIDMPASDMVTPPMMAQKLNTKVITVYEEGEDKENLPPLTHADDLAEFEAMITKSLDDTAKSGDWDELFRDNLTPLDDDDKLMMPSSPVRDKSSPTAAQRIDTVMSWAPPKSGSTPNTDYYAEEDELSAKERTPTAA